MIRIRNPQDLAAGLFLLVVAVLAHLLGANLPTGKLVHMGPGYVPMLLSWLLGGLGLIIAGRGVALDGPALERWSWRPLVALTCAMLVFAGLLETAGLVVATLVTVAVSSLAAPGARAVPTVLLGLALGAICTGLFTTVLGLPLVIWPRLGF